MMMTHSLVVVAVRRLDDTAQCAVSSLCSIPYLAVLTHIQVLITSVLMYFLFDRVYQ